MKLKIQITAEITIEILHNVFWFLLLLSSCFDIAPKPLHD